MLDASKNVLFPGHNHLLSTGTDDPTLIIGQVPAGEGSPVLLASILYLLISLSRHQQECHV